MSVGFYAENEVDRVRSSARECGAGFKIFPWTDVVFLDPSGRVSQWNRVYVGVLSDDQHWTLAISTDGDQLTIPPISLQTSTLKISAFSTGAGKRSTASNKS